MKFNVVSVNIGKCQIILVPENDTERKLVILKDEYHKISKADTFEYYYQRAINFKYGPKAHLTGVTAVNYLLEVIGEYVLEGSVIGR